MAGQSRSPRLSRRSRLLAIAAVGSALLATVLHETGALDGLERKTVDAALTSAVPRRRTVDRDCGARSGEPHGARRTPPIARSHWADLLDRIRAADPRLIGIDIQFVGKTEPDEDDALLDAVRRSGPVLLSTQDTSAGWVPVPAGERDAAGAELSTGAVDSDSDGVIRRMIYAPVVLKTFAVRAAELLDGTAVDEEQFDDNHAWIDFAGPPGTYPAYPLADVLDGTVPASAFKDRVVFVGDTTPVSKDIFSTAISSTPMAGVEIHANVLATILDGFPVQSSGDLVDILLIVLLAALAPVAALRLSAPLVLVSAIGGAVVYLGIAQLLFGSGTIIPIVDPLLALLLGTAAAIAIDVRVEGEQRQALEATIGAIPKAASDFFISYRRAESAWPARTLRTALSERFTEASVFMDTDSIAAGQEWPRRIEAAIERSSVVLVLIGAAWLDLRDADGNRRIDDPADWVRREIETALAHPEIVVVPILLDGASMPDAADLPESLRPLAGRNAVPLTADDWNAEVERLIGSLRSGQLQRHFAARPG